MGSNTIAKASLQLGVDGAGLDKGLGDASNRISKWGKESEAKLTPTKINIPKMETPKIPPAPKIPAPPAPPGGIPPALLKVAVPVAIIAAGITAVKALGDEFVAVADKVRLVSIAARDLGVDLKGFTQIGHAASIAGVESKDLQAGLMNLKTILASSDDEAGRVFSQVGLSVKNLRDLPIDQAVGQIADALKGIKDPSEQARIGLQIFGSEFTRLQPLLNKGESGIAELAREAKKLGLVFGEADAAKLAAAAENLKRLGGAWEGLKNQLSIALAPAVEAVTDAILGLKASFGGIGESADGAGASGSSALQGIVKACGYVNDALNVMNGAFAKYVMAPLLRIQAVVTDVVSNIIDAFDGVGDAISDNVSGPIDDAMTIIHDVVEAVTEFFSAAWDEAVETFTDAWDKVTGIAGTIYEGLAQPVKDAVDAVVAKFSWLTDKVGSAWGAIKGIFSSSKAGDSLREVADAVEATGDKMIGSFGSTADRLGDAFKKMEDRAKEAKDNLGKINPIDAIKAKILTGINELEAELRKSMTNIGKTSAEIKIADLQRGGATDEQVAKVKEMAEQAKNVELAFGNIQMPPLETFNRSVEGLDTLLANGRINLEQYQAGIVEASKKLESAVGDSQTKTVSGQMKDSKEALTASIKGELQDSRQDPQAELKRAMTEAAEIRKKQLAAAEKLVQVLEDKKFDEEFEQF